MSRQIKPKPQSVSFFYKGTPQDSTPGPSRRPDERFCDQEDIPAQEINGETTMGKCTDS